MNESTVVLGRERKNRRDIYREGQKNGERQAEREREATEGEGIAGRLVKWGPHGYVSEVTHVSSTFQTIREPVVNSLAADIFCRALILAR